jgi:peptidoglycan/LPS O-acetylase OafA/YrhL
VVVMHTNGRIRSLDGLRAASIVLVLLAHLGGTRGFFARQAVSHAGDLGNLGVRVFFVISGFLITHLLLVEKGRTGAIDLRAFYVRRALRILPAFLAFGLAVMVSSIAGGVHVQSGDVMHALTFTMNFHPQRAWQVGHLWSLSVEEQFYAVWPAVVAACGAAGGAWVAAAAVVLAPVSRVAVFLGGPSWRPVLGEAFPTVMDAIAVGCLLAMWRSRLHRSAGYCKFLSSPLFVVVIAAIVACNVLRRDYQFSYTLGETMLNGSIALVVDRVTMLSGGFVDWLLNCRPIVAVGTLSYSLYLWQQLFINRESATAWTSFPLNLVLAVAAATTCYFVVERPVLRLRARFGSARAHLIPTGAVDASESAA